MRYYCTENDGRWCALQRQADPPKDGQGAHTFCDEWVTVRKEKRAPTCALCLSLLPDAPPRKARAL